MPETSTWEVLSPCRADFIFVLPDQPEGGRQAPGRESIVSGELDGGLNPELGLPHGMLNMNVARIDVLPQAIGDRAVYGGLVP